jgi:hypothetical protein
VQELESLVVRFQTDERVRLSAEGALDGQPSKALRRLVPLEILREAGVFFTGSELANRTVALISRDLKQGSSVIDPACGAGDLLLACARHLPVLEDMDATMELWGRKLKGSDLHPQLVRATKARLLLLALARGTQASYLPNFDEVFPEIVVNDSLDLQNGLAEADCIALNPPYALMPAPDGCTWATGTVSQAAVFVEKCVAESRQGTKIIAILPDVLRTGSRYERWRYRMERLAFPRSVALGECFDALTDVHVFATEMIVGLSGATRGQRWWKSARSWEAPVASIVEDRFEVRVGPVVPHRDPVDGPQLPYLHARGLPKWRSVAAGSEHRRYSGTTFVPPFVVVRRTSRPEDRYRAVGTIITGQGPVAVENHLLVLKPKTGLIADCRELLENLRAPETNVWLNERIRCRHLTVSALRMLPWWM